MNKFRHIQILSIRLIIIIGMFGLLSTQGSAYDCLLDTNNDGDADSNIDTVAGASSTNEDRVACGKNAVAVNGSVAIGSQAQATNTGDVSIGRGTKATGVFSLSIGDGAQATGSKSVALGGVSTSQATGSIAVGGDSHSAADAAIAIGNYAEVFNTGAIAIGGDISTDADILGAQASGTGIAIGVEALASGIDSIAIGGDWNLDGLASQALSSRTIAIGNEARAFTGQSIAIGSDSDSDGIGATSMGSKSIALGADAQTDGDGSIAIGSDLDGNGIGALAQAAGAIALGADTFNNVANSMLIGVPLRIERDDGTTNILVEESGVAAPRTLFEIKNPGNTKFSVTNSDANEQWSFANPGTGFRLSRQGSGQVELEIKNNGNATLAGTLTENSDINAKQNIKALDQRAILDKVMSLEISEWRYKDDPESKHIGPMAQDFYQAFELGHTDKGISTLDSSGVALVAIQALKDQFQDALQLKDEQIAALKHEMQLIKSRLMKETD